MASSTPSWPLPRKRLIFLAAGSGPPVPSVLARVLAHKQLSPWAGRRKLPVSSWRLVHADDPVAVLRHSGPQEVGKGKDRQRFHMADSSREETQCLAATSKQKLSLLGMTARWKPAGRFLLIQLCMGLLLFEQQRLEGAMCHSCISAK